MQLKRYTTDELIPILTDIFYNYITEESEDSNRTNADDIYSEYQSDINAYKERYKFYVEALQDDTLEKGAIESLQRQFEYLKKRFKLPST